VPRRALAAVLLASAAVAGCGSDGASKARYSPADVKAAYYKARDGGPAMQGYFVDEDFHSHQNYVPFGALEVCPLTQRANAPTTVEHVIEPSAAQPVQQFVVAPKSPDDIRTPIVTQGALVFGTSTIAASGMEKARAAVAKCPASYEVRGGPSPILGTYSVSSRPLETEGWKGVAQQIAHTYPPGQDDVYYEDLTHVIVHRANVILYLDVAHQKIIGERSDSAAKAEAVLKTVLTRLG
jgi:hypothetical protein